MYVAYNSLGDVLINRATTFEGYDSLVEISAQDLVYGMDNDFYEVIDGFFTPKDQSEVDTIVAQRVADAVAEDARIGDIQTAQGTSGLRQYTMAQVDSYLDNRFAAMTDLDSVKTEMRAILDKMIPYLMS